MVQQVLSDRDDHAVVEKRNEDVTDQRLLSSYRSTGEHQLFAQLVHRHEKPLYSYLCRYLGDGSAAQDVLQSTLLKVHQKCGQFDDRRAFRPWLYRIATNQAIDEKRRRKLRRTSSLDAAANSGDSSDTRWSYRDIADHRQRTPLMQVEAREREAWLRQAVDNLPKRLNQVVQLVFFEGLKYQEAADALSLPLGTVKSRMHAATARLRAVWGDTHASGFHLDN